MLLRQRKLVSGNCLLSGSFQRRFADSCGDNLVFGSTTITRLRTSWKWGKGGGGIRHQLDVVFAERWAVTMTMSVEKVDL